MQRCRHKTHTALTIEGADEKSYIMEYNGYKCGDNWRRWCDVWYAPNGCHNEGDGDGKHYTYNNMNSMRLWPSHRWIDRIVLDVCVCIIVIIIIYALRTHNICRRKSNTLHAISNWDSNMVINVEANRWICLDRCVWVRIQFSSEIAHPKRIGMENWRARRNDAMRVKIRCLNNVWTE